MVWHFWGHVAQCEKLNLKVSEAVSPSGADVRGPVGLTAASPSTAGTSASHVAAPRTVLNISSVSCHEKKLFHIILYTILPDQPNMFVALSVRIACSWRKTELQWVWS